MTEQKIDIVVTDKGVKEAASSLKELGSAAKGADASVKGLQASEDKAALNAVKLATAEQKLAVETARVTKAVELSSGAWLINERDLQRAVVAEKQAETAAAHLGTALNQQTASLKKLETEEAKAAVSRERLSVEWLNSEAALNKSITAEAKAGTELAKLETEQNRATLAAQRLETEWLNEERALQDLIGAGAKANASLERLSQEQNKTAISAERLSAEYLNSEASLNRSIAAEAKANAELAKLQAEQSRAAVAARKLEAEWVSEEAALQKAITAQQQAKAALIGVETESNKAALAAQRLATEQQNTETAFNRAQSAALKLQAQQALLANANNKLGVALGKTGAASKGAAAGHKLQAHEMANLGYQVQDIVVSLAGGQNPFMVLLQQGSQIQQIYGNKPGGIANVFGDIAGIIGRMINPVTILAAGLGGAAFAIGNFANRGTNIVETAKLLGQTTDQVQILQQTLNQLSNGKMNFGDFAQQSEDLALKLADAVRNPQQQVARLFAANGKSLTAQNGQLKDQASLWKDSVSLIRTAGTEVDAIEIGKILGLQEDFVRAVYRSKDGFDAVKQSVTETGTILDKETVQRAYEFEKAASKAWATFKTDAESTLLSAGQDLFQFTEKGSAWLKAMSASLDLPDLPDWVQNGLPKKPWGDLDGKPNSTPEPGSLDEVLSYIGLRYKPEMSALGSQGQPAQLARWANNAQGNGTFPGRPENVGAPTVGLQLTPRSEDTIGALASVLTGNGKAPVASGGAHGGIESRPDTSSDGGAPTIKPGATIIPSDAPPKQPKAERVDPLKLINAELDKQIKLLGMLQPQRDVQQRLDDYEIQLMRQKKPLSDDEKASLKDKLTTLQTMAPAQQQLDSMYQAAVGPMQTYNATIEAGNQLLQAGVISTEQYTKSVQAAWEDTLAASDTMSSGIDLGFARVWDGLQSNAETTADFVQKQFGNIEDAGIALATGQEVSWENLSNSIIADIARIIIKLLEMQALQALGLGQSPAAGGMPGGLLGGMGGLLSGILGGGGAEPAGSPGASFYDDPAAGGGAGSWLGPLLSLGSSLIGFADGAPQGFYPGSTNGRTGPDSQLAAFRVSPDERIKVETPAQARAADAAMSGSGAAPQVTVPVKVVNVTDPNEVYNAMDTDAGTKVVINILRRNPGIVRQLASGQ